MFEDAASRAVYVARDPPYSLPTATIVGWNQSYMWLYSISSLVYYSILSCIQGRDIKMPLAAYVPRHPPQAVPPGHWCPGGEMVHRQSHLQCCKSHTLPLIPVILAKGLATLLGWEHSFYWGGRHFIKWIDGFVRASLPESYKSTLLTHIHESHLQCGHSAII